MSMSNNEKIKGRPRNMRRKVEHWQVIAIYLMVYDVIAVNAAYFLALWFRFDCQYTHIPQEYFHSYMKFAPWYTLGSVFVFWILRLYNSIWRFASYSELLRVLSATAITSLLQIGGTNLFFRRMPMSYYCFGTIIQFALVVGIRFSYRFILLERSRREKVRAAWRTG